MLLFGISGLWVMWDQANMLPMCWNARWVDHGGVCDFRFLGPFLLFQGPLVIYSRALAHALISLPRFTTDEARVSGNWSAILKGRRATPRLPSTLASSTAESPKMSTTRLCSQAPSRRGTQPDDL